MIQEDGPPLSWPSATISPYKTTSIALYCLGRWWIQHEFLVDPFRWSHFCGEANGITRPVASWVAKRKNHPHARLSQPKPPNKKESFSPALDTVPVTNINTLAFFEVCEPKSFKHKLHCGNVIFRYSDRSSAQAAKTLQNGVAFVTPPFYSNLLAASAISG